MTLRVSSAILALLTLAATVSAASAGAIPPGTLAGMLVVTAPAHNASESAAPAAGAASDAPARTTTSVTTRTTNLVRTTLLDERLMDLPPPAAA